jgi:hypothetical protein
MPGTLDSILNFLIPTAVVVGILGWFYLVLLREPVNKFIEWIRSMRGKGGNNDGPGYDFGDDEFTYFPK